MVWVLIGGQVDKGADRCKPPTRLSVNMRRGAPLTAATERPIHVSVFNVCPQYETAKI